MISWGPKYFAVKLVKGGPRCPAKVWYGLPADPETGEPLDRSPRWQVLLLGEEAEPERVIIEVFGGEPVIKGEEIDEAEYAHLLQVRQWAVDFAPDAPEAKPREPINLMRMPTVF